MHETMYYSERLIKVVIARSEALHRMMYRVKRRACALKRFGAQAWQSHWIAPQKRVQDHNGSNASLKRGDFQYRLCARLDPATGEAEKNLRAVTAD
jgi:hypothetical protein